MLSKIWQFLNYWYFRYLMVTELYMVEKWERAFFNFFMLVFFSILSYINYIVVLHTSNIIADLFGYFSDVLL